jgi:nicotinamidase-related amidase
MMVAFTSVGASPLACDLQTAIDAIRRVLDAARRRGIPVIFTRQAYVAPDVEIPVWRKKIRSLDALMAGTAGVEIDARLAPRPDEYVVLKKYSSAFFGTPLAPYLNSNGVDTVIVTGCTTSGCVRASVVDALQHGYHVIVPREAVGDRSTEVHEANLFDMDAKWADVIPIGEALRTILSAGGEPSRSVR